MLVVVTSLLAIYITTSHSIGISAATSRVDRMGAKLADHQRELRGAVGARNAAMRSLVELRHDNATQRRSVERRVVSIYKSGGSQGVGDIVVRSHSVDHVAVVADVVNTVARADTQALKRYNRTAIRIHALEERLDSLDGRIKALRAAVTRDIHNLRSAQAQARKTVSEARARAREMARVADVPLTPRAVAPEVVATRVAESVSPPSSRPDSASSPGVTQTGTASMYSDQLAGKPTASGEPYDPAAMTAAHPSLPLGTWVSVRGPGGTALVRINDRGPFVAGRIIDLSRAAANAVGLPGIGTVTLTVV